MNTSTRNAPVSEQMETATLKLWNKEAGVKKERGLWGKLAKKEGWTANTFLSPHTKNPNGSTCTPELWTYLRTMATQQLKVREQKLVALESNKGLSENDKLVRSNAQKAIGAKISDSRKILLKAEKKEAEAAEGYVAPRKTAAEQVLASLNVAITKIQNWEDPHFEATPIIEDLKEIAKTIDKK